MEQVFGTPDLEASKTSSSSVAPTFSSLDGWFRKIRSEVIVEEVKKKDSKKKEINEEPESETSDTEVINEDSDTEEIDEEKELKFFELIANEPEVE